MNKRPDLEEEVEEAEQDLFWGCAKIFGWLIGLMAAAGSAIAAIAHLT